MVYSSVRLCAILESCVILFQVVGVLALCLSRLLPPTSPRWAMRGRAGFVVALFGLGVAGALCGRHDSEFALFAGMTMTLLFIGMTVGTGATDPVAAARGRVAPEPMPAG